MRPFVIPTGALLTALLFLAPAVRGEPDKPTKPNDVKVVPVADLPVTRIVLFNAGIGYFHREGEVTGDARVDLRFDEADVNDLLKSLVLSDAGGGKPKAVTYDNRLPVEYALKGFAVDVTENPSMGQLLHQVRGEKIEVADKSGTTLTGQIVSVEKPQAGPAAAAAPDEKINLLTDDGLQTVELKQVKKLKFVRPELQAEFRKALEVLAASRGDNKKTVSVAFGGNGKRRVAVGYVTEAPLWKTSYRLKIDEKGAVRLMAWATIENTTDEDWKDVKVSLVSGRPMTFQMDMYDPLFVPRPTVEPELFASLRPPMYQGNLNPTGMGMGVGRNPGQGFGGFAGNQGNQPLEAPLLQNGQFGNGQFGNHGGQFGIQGGFANPAPYLPRVPRPDVRTLYGQRLTFEEYLGRSRGTAPPAADPERPPAKTIRDPLDKNSGALAAPDATEVFEVKIDGPVTLPRQKSALVPILDQEVTGSRVSIYNPTVLAKHPLLGLRFKNAAAAPLTQGPVAVYDGGTFAGDARMPDVQKSEERLISYAVDVATEVVATARPRQGAVEVVKVTPGWIESTSRWKWRTEYVIRNRDTRDRTVLIEHPRVSERKLVSPAKAAEVTRSFTRFEVPVKAGARETLEVVEEGESGESFVLDAASGTTLLHYSKLDATKPAVRAVLAKLLEIRGSIEAAKSGIEAEQVALKEIGDDQDRIRKNIERAPKESEAYKRYVKKFDDQETEIEKRQAKVKELRADLAKHEKALRDYAAIAKAE
ncbi:Uncharacterized protein OS=Pirellula staleyi (strain ATCC 27377 / DSM 6068 / ICPB 4128) GN=Psta_1627 PE=4 SV=1: DUF4139: DUF4139 [Gemmataceae bacterium]|nr:Uncharacterized protein OS=Pirellula staleyi (strain ATCC 27377 / DSM 6068 / ICPB 4128) GN=Psta_1627 PE=4 SV=1: DUF4139: DUF4139 [Gemmataceae bacterium]VTU01321.1 Uncharacterized protein OS=Pirellula staleyi (strain ATCC 27377 / DSM 6068 / ICPB 4128) GN=Psta_1627 PE=4 SV=1: DUF4139: DUF4139 [Gemmataceae bacterium]